MKRVFHIDQECFIIFLEDFTQNKDRFLRIGNSEFLKRINDNLTLVDLITRLLPADPFLELQIFKPGVDKIIVGLKNDLDDYLKFLQINNINTDNLKKIYAEEKSNIVVTKKTEEEFLEDIKNNTKIKSHSFASFYNDGNIRIFNREKVIFDLKEFLQNSFHEYKEIKFLYEYYKKDYEKSYKKSGLIHSNKSLFIFSKNKFLCVTGSQNWIKDALKVGINPLEIDILYIANEISPDSLAFKVFSARTNNKKNTNTNIIFRNKELSWDFSFSNELFSPIYADKKNINLKLPDLNINFHKDSIKITYKDILLLINYNDNFLEKGQLINCQYLENKSSFNIIIDDLNEKDYSIFSNNPLIFEKNISQNDYIYKFWNNFNDKIKQDFLNEIYNSDEKYDSEYLPPLENNNNFYYRLFVETIRRITIEGKNTIDPYTHKHYKAILKDFDGYTILKNKIIIEQILGIDSSNNIIMRDKLITKNLQYLEDKINPFLYFQKELSKSKWEELYKEYKEYHKKNIDDDNSLKLIDKRYTEIITNKKNYIEEQNRLERFLNKVIINNVVIRENDSDKKNDISLSDENKITDDSFTSTININDKQKIADFNKRNLSNNNLNNNTILNDMDNALINTAGKNININNNAINNDDKIKKILKVIIPIIIILIVLGLASFFSIFFGPKFIKMITNGTVLVDNTDDTTPEPTKTPEYNNTQDNFTSSINTSFTPYNGSEKRSKHYNFFATTIDVLNYVNEVAILNGYHKIVLDYQKRYQDKKDPDWIYPGSNIKFLDSTIVTIKAGDNLWELSEKFLIEEINKHEVIIRKQIEDTKLNKITINEAKEKFKKISEETHSVIIKEFLDNLIHLDSFEHWEPYIEEIEIDE